MHKLLLRAVGTVLFATSSLSHAETLQPQERFIVGRGIGEVVVRYVQTTNAGDGKLYFYWTKSDSPFQSVPTFSLVSTPSFLVDDFNGDGFNDIVFYNIHAGYAGSPNLGGDVFIYAPQLRRFVKSETLSQRGTLSPSNRKNCTLVQYKSGPTGYTTEEWCFDLKKGRWKLIRSEGGEAENE